MTMAQEVSQVLWRTTKNFVVNQINLPEQTEKVYWIDFSPFERHLYERVREQFRNNRENRFKNTTNLINENNRFQLRNSMTVLDYSPALWSVALYFRSYTFSLV